MPKVKLTCELCNNTFIVIHESEDAIEHCVFCSLKIDVPEEKPAKKHSNYDEDDYPEEEKNINQYLDEDDIFDED